MAEIWHISGVERLLTTLYGEPMRFSLLAERMGYSPEQCASLVDRRELFLMRTAVALIRETLHRSLGAYGGRSFAVLVKRFGLENGHVWTCRQLAAEHGVSPQRISQVEEQAFRRLGSRLSRVVLDAGLRASVTTLLGESPPCFAVQPDAPTLEEFPFEVGERPTTGGSHSERRGMAYRPRFLAAVRAILGANPTGMAPALIVALLRGEPVINGQEMGIPSEAVGVFPNYSPGRLFTAISRLGESGYLLRQGHLLQAGAHLLQEELNPVTRPVDGQQRDAVPVASELTARLPGLVRETLQQAPKGMSIALLVHMLRGSEGPATLARRDQDGITTWGILRDHPFAEVRNAIEELISAGVVRLSGEKVRL